MKKKVNAGFMVMISAFVLATASIVFAAGSPGETLSFPRGLETYGDGHLHTIFEILMNRIKLAPLNLVVTLIFICAILHTFLTSRFLEISHKWEHDHEAKIKNGQADKHSVHHGAELFHFLGEVEAVFGIWVIALAGAIVYFHDWKTVVYYISHDVNFIEPLFVVVIMTLASTRPILKLTELIMWKIANIFHGTLTAWWLTILTLGPILGSLITEPAAMTISALLLAKKLYVLQPTEKFKYATIGLLFVNISVGGTLSHFAAPPVLMVAGPWDWGMVHMITQFGWKAVIGILISNGVYFFVFRRELSQLQKKFAKLVLKDDIQKRYMQRKDLEVEFDNMEYILNDKLGFTAAFNEKCNKMKERTIQRLRDKFQSEVVDKKIDLPTLTEAFDERFEEIKRREMRKTIPGLMPESERPEFYDSEWDNRDDDVPVWVTLVHVAFMIWTIVNAHYPALFISGMLFFLGFAQVTSPYQNRIDLKPPLLVGFFLGGLVIHGGVQGWWIAPVIGNLKDVSLMISATVLTAFNDNAAITFLSTLVPGLTDNLKYAVVAGAVAGGGLTVIANAPNPAGQAILKKYFKNGISPAGLLTAALIPTIIMLACFLAF